MKRKLTLFVVVALVSSTLAACQPKVTTTQTISPGEKSVDENGREMEGNMYLTGLPIVKDKETFSLFVDDSGTVEEKIDYKIFEEQTNVHVDLNLLPYQAATEKFRVLLSSGEYPDVIGGWILSPKDILTSGMNEKMFIPLNDYFDKYAPKINEVLEVPDVRATMTLPDGNIYTIPYVIGEPLTTFSPWINGAWLEKLDLKMPETTEEFKDVLIAFRDMDPNGNGIKDEIPLTFDPDNRHIGVMAGYFGIDASGWDQPRYFTMVDDQPYFSGKSEEFKAFMKWFAELYKEGLVDPELFSQDLAQWKSKGNQDLYGVAMAYSPGDFYIEETTVGRDRTLPKTPFKPLPVLKSPSVDEPTYRRRSYVAGYDKYLNTPIGASVFRTQAVITNKAKNPATIVRWWDNLFQLENSLIATNGPVGVRFEKLPNGEYRDIDADTLTPEEKDNITWAKVFTQALPRYIPVGYSMLPPEGMVKEFSDGGARDALYEPYLGEKLPQFWVGDDIADDYAMLNTNIETYMKKTIAEWASGQKDIDAEWENHLKNLNSLGLPELEKMVQDGVNQVREAEKKSEQ